MACFSYISNGVRLVDRIAPDFKDLRAAADLDWRTFGVDKVPKPEANPRPNAVSPDAPHRSSDSDFPEGRDVAILQVWRTCLSSPVAQAVVEAEVSVSSSSSQVPSRHGLQAPRLRSTDGGILRPSRFHGRWEFGVPDSTASRVHEARLGSRSEADQGGACRYKKAKMKAEAETAKKPEQASATWSPPGC